MTGIKLFFHITKKITTHINRRICAFITHQGRSLEEACREEIIHHRTTLQHTITIVA